MATIETRRDLGRYLQAQMAAGGRLSFADRDEQVDGSTMLKTYLVESHAGDGDATAQALASLAKRVGVHFSAAAEPDLFTLGSGDVNFWLDTSMGRFWRMHTTAKVEHADKLSDVIVASVPWLDNVWLGPTYLESLPTKFGAEMLTFSLSHNRRPLRRSDEPTVGEMDAVTLRLWASHAERTLARLRQLDVFPHGVAVRSVKMRTGAPDADGEFCVAEYFRSGKITASGTSFDEHNRVLVEVLRDYAALVGGIEERFGMGSVDEAGRVCACGNPIALDVDWTLPDLEYAVARIFASADPFRLWALPERIGDDHYRAIATDLHVGGVITFDITPKQVVIQLPRGVCGNTVVRFVNNLRYHVNADVIAPA